MTDVDGDHDGRLADAVAEVASLREENARLRGLLGLDRRPNDGHHRRWAPTLFSAPAEQPRLDRSAPTTQKIQLVRSLFGARSDVFAIRWENATSGRSGWSPAARGGPAAKGVRKQYLPLTDEVIARHLRGDTTIGIYPLLAGDACTLLACDFDGGTWALDALAYLDACHAAEVPAVMEVSRSGDGAHVWIFFEEEVAATTARVLGAALLRQAMATRAELDLSSYDRFFPSQDFMPKGSFGNLIALPLHGRCLDRGTTAFIDPTTLRPWEDQWAFLSSVARLSREAVTMLAESLRPVDAGPGLTRPDLVRKDGPPPPATIGAQLGATISVRRSGLPPAVVAALKHLASIHNPVFYEKQRMRFSTWDTPRFIRCYREDLEWLHLPRGVVEAVEDLVARLGSRLDLSDTRPRHPPLGLRFTGDLRSEQAIAVRKIVSHDRGILVAPPGAGKTVIACAAITHHDVPTLVLVERRELLAQWQDRLSVHLGMPRADIGTIGGGKDRPTGVIDAAMLQTVARREDPCALFDHYGLVVVDECHHIPAVSFEACVRQARSRCWLGLTATPYRRDGLEVIISMQCGPIRHEIKPKELADTALLRRELVVHPTATDAPGEDSGIHDVFAALVADDERTAQICDDVHEAVAGGRTCLVLTQRKDHIDAIVARLRTLGDPAQILRGGMGKKARAAVTDALDSTPAGTGLVLVATGSYLGEGFDGPALDTLFLAFPIAFKGRVVQYVGRLLRAHEGKIHVVLHDYVDVKIPVIERMHHKRLPAYSTLGFDVRRQRRRT